MQKHTLVTTKKKHCWFTDWFLYGKLAYMVTLRVYVCMGNLALTNFQNKVCLFLQNLLSEII